MMKLVPNSLPGTRFFERCRNSGFFGDILCLFRTFPKYIFGILGAVISKFISVIPETILRVSN
ncbi:keratin, type II cytoskeletal 2 epidermal-like [Iris pallida]|uniref:Keratin, type II cytoskeletal 2 epidermal-like n=1 Tax=Iris pallida TaxID=29817 RepID=A0AAX6FWU9_IRIPA|nr:keratin, type II cytoskeletal 2 epidermal-like [Iris pallida]